MAACPLRRLGSYVLAAACLTLSAGRFWKRHYYDGVMMNSSNNNDKKTVAATATSSQSGSVATTNPHLQKWLNVVPKEDTATTSSSSSSSSLPPSKKTTKKKVDPVHEQLQALLQSLTPLSATERAQLEQSLQPRSYPMYETALPCLAPGSGRGGGLLLTKPVKVGGSTAAGVHLRMARHAADQGNGNFSLCLVKWQHGDARKQKFDQRNRTVSRLWTVLRDPTRRILSKYYHFDVTRRERRASTSAFREALVEAESHYSNRVSLYTPPLLLNVTSYNHTSRQVRLKEVRQLVQSVVDDYDFVAVTERMDESLVALAFLWHLPLADMLYFSSKTAGGYDGGGGSYGCRIIQPPHWTPSLTLLVNQYQFNQTLQNAHVPMLVDALAHQLANRSLDRTIDETIGRRRFETALARFREAQQHAQAECAAETRFPCTGGGLPGVGLRKVRRPHAVTDCLESDKGCGYACRDHVATQLDLWQPLPVGSGNAQPLQYRFPGAFGLAPASRQRVANVLRRNQTNYRNLDWADVSTWPTGKPSK